MLNREKEECKKENHPKKIGRSEGEKGKIVNQGKGKKHTTLHGNKFQLLDKEIKEEAEIHNIEEEER